MFAFRKVETSSCLGFAGLMPCSALIYGLSKFPYRKQIQQPFNDYSSILYTLICLQNHWNSKISRMSDQNVDTIPNQYFRNKMTTYSREKGRFHFDEFSETH